MDCTASRTSGESSRGTIRIAGSSITSAPRAPQRGGQAAGLGARPGDDDAPRVQGAPLEPGDRLAPRRHRADEHDRRRANRRLGDRCGQLGERGGHRSLARHRPPLDTSRRLAAVAPRRDQALGHLGQPLDPHVEDERAGEASERVPVERRVVLGGSSWPVTKATAEASSRWVRGMPAYAGAATPAVTPARPRTGFRRPPGPRPPRRRARRRTGRRP